MEQREIFVVSGFNCFVLFIILCVIFWPAIEKIMKILIKKKKLSKDEDKQN
jgi:hypothetical protein